MSEQQSYPGLLTTIYAKQTELDDRQPSSECQTELRLAYEANVAAGKAPYFHVTIRTRGEVHWVMRERGWSGEQ